MTWLILSAWFYLKGVFYNPETPNVNDKAEQLVLVYVTFNDAIVDVLFVLQPEGGFFPLVLMQPWGKFRFLSLAFRHF